MYLPVDYFKKFEMLARVAHQAGSDIITIETYNSKEMRYSQLQQCDSSMANRK